MPTKRPPVIPGNGPAFAGSPWLTDKPQQPEQAEAATTAEPLAMVAAETVAEPAIDVTPLVEIPCSHPGCPKTLPVWTRHAENFAGWLCLEHKADAA